MNTSVENLTHKMQRAAVGKMADVVLSHADKDRQKTVGQLVDVAKQFYGSSFSDEAYEHARQTLTDPDSKWSKLNPTIHRMFNIPVTNGLSEILAGLTDNITVSKTNVENLSILSSGKIPPNPAELLASSRMDQLLSFVKGHYDCVFIDTPPINLVTDASAFAGKVTGYVMIVKAGNTDIPEVRSAVDALESIGAEVVGFILNDATPDRKKYYSYYHKYDRKYKYGYDYGYSYNYK